MSNAGFVVDTTGADALFRLLAELSGKSVPKLVRERAGLLGRILASYTQPVASSGGGALESGDASGLSPQARNLGRSAVSRDLSRVYALPSSVFTTIRDGKGMKFARQFSALMKSGKYGEAERFIRDLGIKGSALQIEPWDDGARHKARRNKQGRINRGNKPVITTDSKALKDYRKAKIAMVGYSKSSWLTAARQIPGTKGLSRIPAWIKKHNAPGRGIDRTQGNTDNPYIVLESALPWMENAFSAHTNNAIFRHFGDLVQKDLEHAIKAIQAKAARLTNAAPTGAGFAKAA